MKKVISFSLWGDNKTYNVGAIRNAELAQNFYPDFECWFYIHKDTVPEITILTLDSLSNTKIILKTGDLNNENCKPRMWRFEPIDDNDVEIMMPRDTDTRILPREVMAVNDWLQSNKTFHIMRDHPHHSFEILAGMFGTKKIQNIPSWGNIIKKYNKKNNRMYDQDFLREYIYPLIKNDSVIHASFNKMEKNAKNFPIIYTNELRFVGEYVYFDDSRSIEHIKILKSNLV